MEQDEYITSAMIAAIAIAKDSSVGEIKTRLAYPPCIMCTGGILLS